MFGVDDVVVPVAVALLTKLGGKLIDSFWGEASAGNPAVIKQDGTVGLAASNAGRTVIRKEYTSARNVSQPAHIVGKIYIPSTLEDLITGEEVALVLVTEERTLQPYLFVADLDAGYEIYLPAGVYSFYVFLMDTSADDFFDAEIYGVGFRSRINLSQVNQIEAESHDDIWEIVDDAPIRVKNSLQYELDFILIDTAQIPGFPQYFGELLDEDLTQSCNLTGIWQLDEEYEYGTATAELYLVQTGAELSGMMLRHDIMDDGNESVVQEFVSGEVEADAVSIYGTSYRVIYGNLETYYLDQWDGFMEDDGTISGTSEDAAGSVGVFILRCLASG